ncbi:transcription repressor OFP14 [Primulina tabacum]|uniref:transcription repressor OFP14 n=1 Tax=Primulina tabacum TaxID=48773 RepID=UPI003F599D76
MPTQIQKSFQEYLSKIKISNKQIQLRWKSGRHAKTTSFASGGGPNDAVAFSGIDQFLFENFSSLYQLKEHEEDALKGHTTPFPFDSPKLIGTPPPENLCGSARFFVAAGSSSSLITDEAFSSSTSAFTTGSSAPEKAEQSIAEEELEAAGGDFFAILTYSSSPYEDFRRSMQEMVEARLEQEGEVDWEFMEELLFCYLDLNNKSSYRFILHAFVDLVVVQDPGQPSALERRR